MESRLSWFLFVIASLLASLTAQDDPKFSLSAALVPATAKPGDAVKLVLTARTAPGWHAYGTMETMNPAVSLDADSLQLTGLELAGGVVIPPGTPHPTPVGTQFPLDQTFQVIVPLKVAAGATAIKVTGELGYQICNESTCEPPSAAAFVAQLQAGGGAAAANVPASTQEPKKPIPMPGLGVKPGLRLEPEGEAKVTVRASFEPPTVRAGEVTTLVLDVDVIDGYHAYGALETTNQPISFDPTRQRVGDLEFVGEPILPPGDAKETPIGPQYPLPHHFQVKHVMRVPAGTEPGSIDVTAVLDYQLCTDTYCEAPAEGKAEAKLVVEPGSAAGAKVPASTQEPKKPIPVPGLGVKPGLRLEPEGEAKLTVRASFEPSTVRAGEVTTLVLDVDVIDGYHAYGALETANQPIDFDPTKQDVGDLELVGEPIIPPGDAKETPIGPQYPLPHHFQVKHVMRVPAGTEPGTIDVTAVLDYQLCTETYCEDAAEAEADAKLVVEAGEARAELQSVPAPSVGDGAGPAEGAAAEGDDFAEEEDSSSWWLLILQCIGGGLFALAMPCTYPMIPITFSFFTKQAEKRGGNVLGLTVVYGLGIIAMFVLVGVVLSAVIIDIVNHWVTNTVIGVMFFFFAFVLFGWINLSPPQWMNKLAYKAQGSAAASKETSGMVTALLGVFFMGATLVITSFTCTAPIVGTLIANVAAEGWLRVAVGMAIFGLTMAIPFMALSLMPGKVKAMPKSGDWMETLKISLGFVELAAAFKFVSMVDFALGWQALPRELFLMLWAAIFGLWAMYLFGILRKAGTVNEGVSSARMASGMFVTLLAAYFLFGALGNRLDKVMTSFIPGYSNAIASKAGGHDAKKSAHIIVYDDPEQAMERAKKEGKLLLYNFTGFS